MREDNRVHENRSNGTKRRTSPAPGAGRPEGRPRQRTSSPVSGGRQRRLDAYSIDVAAQRGVVRDDRAQRRDKKVGDVKVPGSNPSSRRDYDRDRRHTGENTQTVRTPGDRDQAGDAQRRKSRNVDVAQARKSSGKVDVQTGRRLDGRVRVPVDKRRNHTPEDERRKSQGKGANPRPDGRPDRSTRGEHRPKQGKRPDTENRKKSNNKNSKMVKKNTRSNPQPKKKKTRRKPTPEEIQRKQLLKKQRLERRRQRLMVAGKVLRVVLKTVLVLAVISGIALAIINGCYKLKKVSVSGTDHYSDQQMEQIVSGGKKYTNTLFFIINNKFNPPEDVTFVDKIDVDYVDRHTVSITVYEKAMAGCIKYKDKYAYFDGDGIVLEISAEKLDDVPCIEGLKSKSVTQGKKLTVGDDSFFQEILTMTQLIFKNDIHIDKITYDKKQNLILHKDGIKIKIGSADNIENKFMNLESILATLKGKKGTLDMSNYSASSGSVIFKENK